MITRTVEMQDNDDAFDLDDSHPKSFHTNESDVLYESDIPVEETKLTVTDVLSYLFVFIVLIIMIPATIVSTFEISNRVSFLVLIGKEIDQRKTESLDFDKIQPKTDNNQKTKTSLLSEINTLEKFRDTAYIIIANGAIPMEGDVLSFRDLLVLKAKTIQGNVTLSSVLQGAPSIHKSKTLEGSPFIARIYEINMFINNLNDVASSFVCNYNSNSLLAVSLILSCIIGSLACHFKKESGYPFLLRSIISGLVMGFVVYLIVKGGRGLVVGQENDMIFSLNLYGSCFASLLAGVFADKLFRLLKSLVGLLGRKS